MISTLFLFCPYFPVNLIVLLKLLVQKKSVLSFIRYHSSLSVCFFLVPSIDLYLLDYLG